jgi:hypothetical protein
MNANLTLLRQLSPQDFATFGLNDIAYVKPVVADGGKGFAIHAADGTRLTVMADRLAAFAAVRQHDMEPYSVH